MCTSRSRSSLKFTVCALYSPFVHGLCFKVVDTFLDSPVIERFVQFTFCVASTKGPGTPILDKSPHVKPPLISSICFQDQKGPKGVSDGGVGARKFFSCWAELDAGGGGTHRRAETGDRFWGPSERCLTPKMWGDCWFLTLAAPSVGPHYLFLRSCAQEMLPE